MPLDAAARATLETISTATITTVLLKKGLRNVWMRGTRRLTPGQPRMVGPGLHPALRPGARGPGDAGKLGLADLDPRRDRGDAGRLHRRGGRHGRDRCRHLRRHPLRPHGQARRRRAGHRRRRCATSPACSAPACRCGASGGAAPPSVAGLTFVGWQEPIGCGGVAVFPDDVDRGRRRRRRADPRGVARRRAGGRAVEQERLEGWIMGEVDARRAAARPLSAERREPRRATRPRRRSSPHSA